MFQLHWCWLLTHVLSYHFPNIQCTANQFLIDYLMWIQSQKTCIDQTSQLHHPCRIVIRNHVFLVMKLNLILFLKIYITVWKKQRTWICSNCERIFFVKLTKGLGRCFLCPDITKSNNERTKCVDPYNNNYLEWRNTSTIIPICLSVAGMLFCFLTIVLFIKFRSTPVVTSSNFISSFLQIISVLIFFMIFPVIIVGKPSTFCCKIQPIFVGLIFTLIIATLLTKVQNALTVFRAKHKITRHEKLVSKSIRTFIVALFLLISATIFVVTLFRKEIKMITVLDATFMQWNIYCNSYIHLHCQVVYIALMLLLWNIQGYRARQLPENFKESKVIIHGSFISNVCLLLIFPLFYSQENEVSKASVNLIVLLVTMMILLFTMFGGRIYVLVFRPDLNTKEHFKQVIMKMTKEAAKLNISNNRTSMV